MYKRFPAAPALVVSVLATYFLVGTLSTGGIAAPLGVLVLVLVLWFSLYRFRHHDSSNQELLAKMRSDLERTLEGIAERLAQEEARRRAAEEQEERARVEREMRRANRPVRDPTMGKYAGMIEDRVRASEQTRRESEGL
jgi:ABC-type transport system involved in cytochrome bd biosynthesis fused ATPase/permease subunit